jgi:hypothetical protein
VAAFEDTQRHHWLLKDSSSAVSTVLRKEFYKQPVVWLLVLNPCTALASPAAPSAASCLYLSVFLCRIAVSFRRHQSLHMGTFPPCVTPVQYGPPVAPSCWDCHAVSPFRKNLKRPEGPWSLPPQQGCPFVLDCTRECESEGFRQSCSPSALLLSAATLLLQGSSTVAACRRRLHTNLFVTCSAVSVVVGMHCPAHAHARRSLQLQLKLLTTVDIHICMYMREGVCHGCACQVSHVGAHAPSGGCTLYKLGGGCS